MIYNPRTICRRFVEHRDAILERIQALIDRGDARALDGVRFESDLGRDEITEYLRSYQIVKDRKDRRYKGLAVCG